MTKALFCLNCADIRGFQENWVACKCGNVEARWTNPTLGHGEVRAKDRHTVRVIGFNNQMIYAAAEGVCADVAWRGKHETAATAPGYLFDKERRNCWAVIFRVGDTNDVKWAEEESDVWPVSE